MATDKEKAYNTALKTQERHNNGKKELASIKAQIIPLQETVDNLEEDLRLRDEEINRLQDSLATAQADIARARQDILVSPAPSTITGKRSVKFPDPPIFIGDNNPPFEDWSLKLHDKLAINEDHFETDKARAAYAIGRTGGNASEHINAYRVTDAAYFKTVDMVIEVLRGVYADSDRQRNVRQKYLALKQGASQEFALFFSEFARLGRELGYLDAMLRQDLETKLNRGLKSTLANNPRDFDNLSQMKDYLVTVDNARRRIKAEDDRDGVLKKDKATNKPYYTSTHNGNRASPYTRTTAIVAKPIVATPAPVPSPLANAQDSKEGNCFICHKQGHLARDCLDKEGRAAMIKELQLGSQPNEDYDSQPEN